jgi:acetyl-CoA synthetase
VAAFVTLKEGTPASDALIAELEDHVVTRRLLRDIAEGKTLGDTTTLADPSVVARLKELGQAAEAGDRPPTMVVMGRREYWEARSGCIG